LIPLLEPAQSATLRRLKLGFVFKTFNLIPVLLGGMYTHASGVSIIVEFYTPPNTAYYRPAQMPASVGRQHYGLIRVSTSRLRELPGWKEWDVAASLLANLDDGSHIATFDAGRRLGNHFYAYMHTEAPAGKGEGSQYGMILYSSVVSAFTFNCEGKAVS
jgi:hypothetical protein